jgi:hypothetical protein
MRDENAMGFEFLMALIARSTCITICDSIPRDLTAVYADILLKCQSTRITLHGVTFEVTKAFRGLKNQE